MGYYSDVVFKFELESAEDIELVIKDLREWLAQEKEEGIILTSKGELDPSIVVVDKDTATIWLTFYGVKWYDSFHEVQAIEAWYERIADLADYFSSNEEENDALYGKILSVQRVVIGEDLEDYEINYYGDVQNYMNIVRKIEL